MKLKNTPILMNRLLTLLLIFFLGSANAAAQTAEIKLSFNEQFFDALLDAVFTHLAEPSVPLSSLRDRTVDEIYPVADFRFPQSGPWFDSGQTYNSRGISAIGESCDESVKLKREVDGVRTAVRFRQGKIYVPIAFSGNYNPPLIGCIEFQGWAETNIELTLDKKTHALVGHARVLNVNLSGTGGVGGGLMARMVQNSIDQKVNPIEIVSLDKLSFAFPVQKSGTLKMKARGIRYQVNQGSLDVVITYEFQKGG